MGPMGSWGPMSPWGLVGPWAHAKECSRGASSLVHVGVTISVASPDI